jgi:uncharacterized protein YecT (DUF1311 family)
MKRCTQTAAMMLFAVAPMLTFAANAESMSQSIRKIAPRGVNASFYACLDKAGTSAIDEASCIADEESAQDARLNKAYKKLLGSLKGNMKPALVASEKEWLNSRSKDSAFETLLYGGDSQPSNLAQEQSNMFKLVVRANTLEEYLAIIEN